MNEANATDLTLALRRKRIRIPLWQEISDADGLAFGVDGYLVPIVLNSGDVDYLVRAHVQAIKKYGEAIPWSYVLPIGYIVMNDDCAVARRTKAEVPRDIQDVCAYASYAVKMCGLKILYVEYSGVLGDPEVPKAIKMRFPDVQVFYGGGISNPQDIDRFQSVSSTVVVGNALYDGAFSSVCHV